MLKAPPQVVRKDEIHPSFCQFYSSYTTLISSQTGSGVHLQRSGEVSQVKNEIVLPSRPPDF